MKKILYISFIFISLAAMAQEKKIVWDYPVKPGTEGWVKCDSPDEIYRTLQIPENILKKIDTETLVQICLDYPASTVFYIFNTPQQGFDGFYRQFNGIQELMSRKDAGLYLFKKYAEMSLDDFNPLWSLETQGEFVEKFYYMELFLVQPTIIKSFSKEERKILLKESLKKFDMKRSREDLFGGFNAGASIWVMARVLHTENKLNLDVANVSRTTVSLESGQLIDLDVTSVYQQAKSYCHE
jgi:hypothetical protein